MYRALVLRHHAAVYHCVVSNRVGLHNFLPRARLPRVGPVRLLRTEVAGLDASRSLAVARHTGYLVP